jgi:hypothetical protein
MEHSDIHPCSPHSYRLFASPISVAPSSSVLLEPKRKQRRAQ